MWLCGAWYVGFALLCAGCAVASNLPIAVRVVLVFTISAVATHSWWRGRRAHRDVSHVVFHHDGQLTVHRVHGRDESLLAPASSQLMPGILGIRCRDGWLALALWQLQRSDRAIIRWRLGFRAG